MAVKRPWWLIALATLAFVLAACHILTLLVVPIDGHDSGVHLTWLSGYAQVFGAGSLFPRWIPNAFLGLGAPIFDRYPPVTYIIGAVVNYLCGGASPSALYRSVALIGYAGSALTMWWYARTIGQRGMNLWVITLLYTFNPYRFHTLLTRSALSEHMSFMWLPAILLAATMLLETRRSVWSAALGLFLGLLFLTNVPVALSACIALTAFAVANFDVRNIGRFAGAAAIAIGVAMPLLAPAAVTNARFFSEGLFHSGEHSPLMEPITSGYVLNRALLPTVFLFTCLLAWSARRKDESRQTAHAVWFASCTLLVLQLPFVYFALEHALPYVGLIQFPWRVTPVVLTLVLPMIVLLDGKAIRRFTAGTLSIGAIAVMVVAFASVAGLRLGQHVATDDIRPEYFSSAATIPVDSMSARLVAAARDASLATLVSRGAHVSGTPTKYTLDATSNQGHSLRMTYWPEWSVRVNGKPVTLNADSLGLATIAIPDGVAHLEFTLRTTNVERASEAIGLVSIVAALLCLAFGMWRSTASHEE